MAKVSSRCASYDGGSAGTTKTSSPPCRGTSWATAGSTPAVSTRTARPATASLDVNSNLEGIARAVHVGVKGVVDLVQGEMVADDGVGHELARAHESQRAAAVHPTLPARSVDANVAAHREVHVHLDGTRVPGDHADAPAPLHVLERVLHRGRSARAFQDRVGALAARVLGDARAEILAPHVDDVVGAELPADLEALVARAAQDHALGAHGLAELHGHEPDGPRPEDEHGLPRHVAAHEVDGPQRRGGRGDHAGLLEGERVRQPVQRVDVVDRVLREAAVAREPLGAMTLGEIAVVQAGRVPALDAVLAALAALVHLDGHAIAHAELVHARPEDGHRACVLVAHDELALGLALELAVEHLDVG